MKLILNALLVLICVYGALFLGSCCAQTEASDEASTAVSPVADGGSSGSNNSKSTWNRADVLVVSLTIFVLAVFVGFEIIAKVPPTLHTPLMSGSNAISGITVIGAVIAAGQAKGGFGCFLGLIAVILSMINVVGGFYVTHRMLLMFKRK